MDNMADDVQPLASHEAIPPTQPVDQPPEADTTASHEAPISHPPNTPPALSRFVGYRYARPTNIRRHLAHRHEKYAKDGESANRKFRRWFLIDQVGQEHLAVHTTKLDSSGHFTYEAVCIYA